MPVESREKIVKNTIAQKPKLNSLYLSVLNCSSVLEVFGRNTLLNSHMEMG